MCDPYAEAMSPGAQQVAYFLSVLAVSSALTLAILRG
ncbi:hypothetical protein GA0115259_113345 [Streptomyces sp. MnatMP-M17]|nr:hypothetical protein GA0115259_113345 [Streptomyces sp. MnatMP-M17]